MSMTLLHNTNLSCKLRKFTFACCMQTERERQMAVPYKKTLLWRTRARCHVWCWSSRLAAWTSSPVKIPGGICSRQLQYGAISSWWVYTAYFGLLFHYIFLETAPDVSFSYFIFRPWKMWSLILLDFAIQGCGWVVSAALQTEKFYDATGKVLTSYSCIGNRPTPSSHCHLWIWWLIWVKRKDQNYVYVTSWAAVM